jgi:DNA-binding MarR family transcriptional regulator
MSKNQSRTNSSNGPNEVARERVIGSFDRFHAWLTKAHVPDFLELNLTMAQMRAMYLVVGAGPMRMSQVAERLGTAPSSATGLVDALVATGMLERIADPADRRQVLVRATPAAHARIEAFSELNRTRLRSLLAEIRSADDLVTIERAIDLLTDAAGRAERDDPQ